MKTGFIFPVDTDNAAIPPIIHFWEDIEWLNIDGAFIWKYQTGKRLQKKAVSLDPQAVTPSDISTECFLWDIPKSHTVLTSSNIGGHILFNFVKSYSHLPQVFCMHLRIYPILILFFGINSFLTTISTGAHKFSLSVPTLAWAKQSGSPMQSVAIEDIESWLRFQPFTWQNGAQARCIYGV